MNIKINYIRQLWSPSQLVANIVVDEINGEDPVDYFIALDKEEDSEIHQYLRDKIESKQVDVLPPFEEYTRYVEERNIRDLEKEIEFLLRNTDQFMTIDTELSDSEINEMKEYRKLLRSVRNSEKKSMSIKDLPSLPKFIKQENNRLYYFCDVVK